MEEDSAGPQSGRRVSVDEAARRLGLTVDAVRKRVQRNQLAYEKDAAGRVRIILDEAETLRDKGPDTTRRTTDILLSAKDETIAELRDRVRSLEEANRENRRIIAALTQRIPELPASTPPDAPGSPETATEASAEGAVPPTGEGRPWWRRMFYG